MLTKIITDFVHGTKYFLNLFFSSEEFFHNITNTRLGFLTLNNNC